MTTSVFIIVGVAVASVLAMFGMGWWMDRHHSRDGEGPGASEEASRPRAE